MLRDALFINAKRLIKQCQILYPQYSRMRFLTLFKNPVSQQRIKQIRIGFTTIQATQTTSCPQYSTCAHSTPERKCTQELSTLAKACKPSSVVYSMPNRVNRSPVLIGAMFKWVFKAVRFLNGFIGFVCLNQNNQAGLVVLILIMHFQAHTTQRHQQSLSFRPHNKLF